MPARNRVGKSAVVRRYQKPGRRPGTGAAHYHAYGPRSKLYRVSFAYAIAADLPAVIVFAAPAFWASLTCGPQVDTVSELRARHPDAASCIYIELYDSPAELPGDLSRARRAPADAECGFTQIDHRMFENAVAVGWRAIILAARPMPTPASAPVRKPALNSSPSRKAGVN